MHEVCLDRIAIVVYAIAVTKPQDHAPSVESAADAEPVAQRVAAETVTQIDLPAPEHVQATYLQHCAACHTVRGTAAAGVLGPDLTHVGSRMSLIAAMLPNNVGTVAGWIASSQHLKPGNRMPSFDRFSATELNALAGYVASLQ